ncbi:Predicted alpha-1,6-mannanase, GH76 family [Pseudonocardia thermophila]|uniref:Predicted alpha-1,6-mannanase, GH76 family n=1 Tax=Pseudonocardia thermophila TaxID=1848 RepID=A0A1M6VKG0_PSETH|nr:Predicted alpha-1,6-mannanase, GH76 family [Pseudonocardia thermophila]
MRVADTDVDWTERAAAAERAVVRRHLRPVAGVVPSTRLGRERWPRKLPARPRPWHPWWQAQLLECLLDAQQRSPSAGRARTISALVRGIRLRNRGRWVTRRLADTAWLGVALQRAGPLAGRAGRTAEHSVTQAFYRGWSEAGGGGLWARRGARSGLKPALANAPAAVMMARVGQIDFAGSIADWIADTLVDEDTGLVRAGAVVSADGQLTSVDPAIHAAAQGAYLAACTELARRDDHSRWGDRAIAIVDAVQQRFANGHGSLPGAGGGDGGLQAGVLARYLADAGVQRSELTAAVRRLVLGCAEQAWLGRLESVGGPVFSVDWAIPAARPGKHVPEADLSVQLAGWMLMEAAARLQRSA